MWARILGPLELNVDGRRLPLGAPKQRVVAALLIVRTNEAVTVDEVIDEIWGDHPPRSARANARMYAANLRRQLYDLLDVHRDWYRLALPDHRVDLAEFRRAIGQARVLLNQRDFAAALGRLDAALTTWTGRPLADVPVGPTLRWWRSALIDEHLRAREDRAEALLGLGAYDQAWLQAGEVLAQEPLRERAHALHIRARYEAGDTAGALAAHHDARRILADELGLDPGPELSALHQAMLRGDAVPVAARIPPAGRPSANRVENRPGNSRFRS
jgi:DNA-binding SARP family transcriptional activator